MRDRRGRGARGPLALPGPLSPAGVPAQLSRRDSFDALTLDVVEELTSRWAVELRDVEFGVEEVPLLPADWPSTPIPLATLVRGGAGSPTRIVVFRLPVQQRASGQVELERLVREALVAQVAELLGRDPDDIAPPP
jgi:hypothetical protein